MALDWTLENSSKIYRHKFESTTQIIAEWLEPYGGIKGRNILEFGCGEGIMALGLALQHNPTLIVGVEITNAVRQCQILAQQNLGLVDLPNNLKLLQIDPGQSFLHLGKFDFAFSWSVFEHVSLDLLSRSFQTIEESLKPGGVFMLQISPLYYSCFGSHLEPWINEPWGHLLQTNEAFERAFLSAPEASSDIMESWSVYQNFDGKDDRTFIWDTY